MQCDIYVQCGRHFFQGHIPVMWNVCMSSLLVILFIAVMWGLHVYYISSAVTHVWCGRHICIGHMPIIWNVCIPVLVVTLLIVLHPWHIYWCSCLISIYECIGICGISMAFERHICYWPICGNSMVNKSCSLLFWDVGSICRLQEQYSGTHI